MGAKTIEKRPAAGSGWHRRRVAAAEKYLDAAYHSIWMRNGIVAMSTLELAEAPDGKGDSIPQWHISFSRGGEERCADREVNQALVCFGLVGAEEDNHHPGIARHFWMPLDPSRRVDCECKASEKTIVDADGYRWTTPVEGECHGCDYQRMMLREQGLDRPCPIHAAKAEAV